MYTAYVLSLILALNSSFYKLENAVFETETESINVELTKIPDNKKYLCNILVAVSKMCNSNISTIYTKDTILLTKKNIPKEILTTSLYTQFRLYVSSTSNSIQIVFELVVRV